MPIIINKISGLISAILILAIFLYKKVLSPVFGNQCRFRPSCSQYASIALKKHGCTKGVMLASYRILRCNPFCESGHDPVPEQFSLFYKLKP